MREILQVIDDMPREEQLICVQRLHEAWWDYDDNRANWKAWWEKARRKGVAFQEGKRKPPL
jgi:hypothetical protein